MRVDCRIVTLLAGDGVLPFNGLIIKLDLENAGIANVLKGSRGLAKIISEFNPDIVQANAGDTAKVAVISKLIYRWHQPIIFRNASTISGYMKKRSAKLFYSGIFRFVARVISVSETSKIDFVKNFPFIHNRITHIPIGVNIDTSTDRHDPYPERLGARLVHVGGFTFEKNHYALINIFRMIRKEHPEARLWLVGSGKLKPEIEQHVEKEGLSNHVFFAGQVSNPLDYIGYADVLLLPSLIEGLPAVILEAMLVKTPVVAYNVGGVSEVVANRSTGILVEKDDETTFAHAVGDILKNSTECRAMVDRAYEMVIERFSNGAIAHNFLNEYTKLLTEQKE